MNIPDWEGYLRFRDGFAAAMDPAFHRIEELEALVLSGRALLWIGTGAAIAAEVRGHAGGARVLHGLVAAGRLAEIRDELIPAAEAWARDAGCTHAMIESRPGWARLLAPAGYEIHQVIVRKEL